MRTLEVRSASLKPRNKCSQYLTFSSGLSRPLPLLVSLLCRHVDGMLMERGGRGCRNRICGRRLGTCFGGHGSRVALFVPSTSSTSMSLEQMQYTEDSGLKAHDQSLDKRTRGILVLDQSTTPCYLRSRPRR